MNCRSFLFQATFELLAAAARVFTRDDALKGSDSRRLPEGVARPPEPWRSEADAFARWRAAARQPIMESSARELRPLLSAVRLNRPVRFRYFGGSPCGIEREVMPGLLFTVDGFPGAYLSGYCHGRRISATTESGISSVRITLMNNART